MTQEILPFKKQLTDWLMRKTPITGVRRVARFSAALATEVGNVRSENQDRVTLAHGRDRYQQSYTVVAVADGMGGMLDGAFCAATVVAHFLSAIDMYAKNGSGSTDCWIREAASSANETLYQKYRGEGGATLVALILRQNSPTYWLSIGDSRVYLTKEEKLEQVSVDDTIAGQLGKTSDIASEQAKLLQFVGMGEGLEPHIASFDDDADSMAMLTTDGLHYIASEANWLGQIIDNAPDPGVCAKRLIEVAKWCGGHDNATVALIPTKLANEFSRNHDYDCLEIWDSFGELQIVSTNSLSSNINSKKNINSENENPLQPKDIKNSDKDIKEKPGVSATKSPSRPSSKRGNKTNKQAKPETKSSKNRNKKSDNHDVPQLHMEFPTKHK